MRNASSLLPLGEGGSLSWGVSVRGVRGQTDACENITLPQTSFADGKIVFTIV